MITIDKTRVDWKELEAFIMDRVPWSALPIALGYMELHVIKTPVREGIGGFVPQVYTYVERE